VNWLHLPYLQKMGWTWSSNPATKEDVDIAMSGTDQMAITG